MSKILSIEIDDQIIKILEGFKKEKQLSISKFISLNTPLESIDDGRIINLDLVKKAIEKALIGSSIKTKRVIFVINTTSIIIRKIELPLLKSKSETLSMIKYELEQLLSTDLSQYKLIYKKTELFTIGKMHKAKYNVYALPDKIYNQYIELSEKLKLNMLALNFSFNYLDKIKKCKLDINGKKIKNNSTNAFINIGYSTTNFSVINDGINDFSRISSSGIKDMVEKLVEELGLSLIEALGRIENLSLIEDDSILLDNKKISIAKNIINSWIEEFNRYIRYYNSVNKDKNIEKIYIYGPYSKIVGLEQYLSSALNMEVETIKDISNIKIGNIENFNKFDLNIYFNGMLSLLADRNDINFLSYKQKKHRKKFNQGIAIMAASLILILTLSFYFFSSNIKKNTLQNQTQTMRLFIHDIENINNNNEIEKLKNRVIYLERYREQAKKLKTIIINEDCVNTDIIREIANAIQPGTELKYIFIDKTNIQMRCISKSIIDVSLIERNLKRIEILRSVYIPEIQVNQMNEEINCSYSIICKLKDVDNNEIE